MRVRVFYHDKCFDGACSASLFTRFHRECVGPAGAEYEYHGLVHRAGALFNEADFTGDEAGMVGQFEIAGLVQVDLAVARHRIEAPCEHAERGGIDFQSARQGCCVKRGICIAKNAENFLAAGNGVGSLVQIVFCNCF